MKYLVKIFVIIIFLFCNNLSYAENLIVYIDMEKILNESKSGMSINKQLEKIHKINIKEYKKIENELKNSIFANHFLVMEVLNEILDYNE